MNERKKTTGTYEQNGTVLVPAVDIYETENEYSLTFDMPGVSKENLEITVHNNELEVKGNVEPYESEGKELKYAEYRVSEFYRKFQIGDDVDKNEISASFDKGILSLILKKHEEQKPRKIEITTAQK